MNSRSAAWRGVTCVVAAALSMALQGCGHDATPRAPPEPDVGGFYVIGKATSYLTNTSDLRVVSDMYGSSPSASVDIVGSEDGVAFWSVKGTWSYERNSFGEIRATLPSQVGVQTGTYNGLSIHWKSTSTKEVWTRLAHPTFLPLIDWKGSVKSLNGFFKDPNHYVSSVSFNGIRFISANPTAITVIGKDNSSSKYWTVYGSFTGKRTFIVNFSPKGGPTALAGSLTNTGITWEDGNVWTKQDINARPFIDKDTPPAALSKKMPDGSMWELVFSDEFEEAGRKFRASADPKWVATDGIKPPANAEFETYVAKAVTTANGTLNLAMELPSCNGTAEQACNPTDPGFYMTSGQVSTWNRFCATGGFVEVKVSLPGKGIPADPKSVGFWPAVWMLGNLGRVNYQASMDGMWPYSYDSCVKGPAGDLPPQRFPNTACRTAPSPLLGPHGRGVPEFDLAEVMVSNNTPTVSQTFQVAPFNEGCQPVDSTAITSNPAGPWVNPPTKQDWVGCQYQQSVGYSTGVAAGQGFNDDTITFGGEWRPGVSGYIEWSINGIKTWRMGAAAVGASGGRIPAEPKEVGARQIPAEPMYIILNLAMSYSWAGPLPPPGYPDPSQHDYPAVMRVHHVRVYQPPDAVNFGCDPPGYPTAAYIESDPNGIYTNPAAVPPVRQHSPRSRRGESAEPAHGMRSFTAVSV